MTGADGVPARVRYRVGDLVVDLGRQQVLRAGVEVPLPKLSFDLLVALARVAPNLAALDELMAAVWPGVVVSPETVSQRVKLLRDALSDDAREPRYVAGLRGRGYRLVPEVVALGPESPSLESLDPTPPNETSSQPSSPASIVRRWAPLVAVLLLAAGLGSWWVSRTDRQHSVPSAIPARSVAVLPFENLSPDPADQHLAPGIADVVQQELAASPGLVVIASTSSFAVRERESDPRALARSLGVRFLVDGSVQRAGDRLRVVVHLIDTQTAARLRSLRFDREIADVLALEGDIARAVAEALELDLGGAGTPPVENLDAHLAYLRAKSLLARYRVDDTRSAIAELERSVALEPHAARSWLALAEARVRYAWLTQRDAAAGEEWGRVRPLVERALGLDPSLGEALVMRGWWNGDEAELRRGLALAPNYGPGHARLSELLCERGRHAEELEAINAAVRVDPFSARHHHLRGLTLVEYARWEEAEASFLRALEVDPNFHPSLTRLAMLERVHWGRLARATQLVERALATDPRSYMARLEAVSVYLELGDVAAAREISRTPPGDGELREAELWIALHEGTPIGAVEGLDPAETAILNRVRSIPDGEIDSELRRLETAHAEVAAAASVPAICARAEIELSRAQLLLRKGERSRGLERIAAALAEVEGRDAAGVVDPFCPPTRAIAFALRGDRDAALAALNAALVNGQRGRLRSLLERDPALASIRPDARFQALLARIRAHALSESAEVEALRARGELPNRAALLAG